MHSVVEPFILPSSETDSQRTLPPLARPGRGYVDVQIGGGVAPVDIISSEVFEHIVPSVSRAFENAWKMLEPRALDFYCSLYEQQRHNRTLPGIL
jgi:hypothetical protein